MSIDHVNKVEPIIKFEKVNFRYKSQELPTLYDISFELLPGEKMLILGASGSGKSTLANCINGLIPFSYDGELTGQIRIAGKDPREASIFELSKSVGTVLQDSDAQFVGHSVGEDIAFSMENDMMPRREMVPLVKQYAGTVGMQEFLRHIPYDLSGGQKQKVAIAGTLGADVEILVFDEPLASLDPETGEQAIELIDNLVKNLNCSAVIIEHRLEDVLHCPVDKILLMSEGRIVADMTPAELLSSTLLMEHGIREPLYISAMKYAGCTVRKEQKPENIDRLSLTDEEIEKLRSFYSGEREESDRSEIGEEIARFEDVAFSYNGVDTVLSDLSFSIRKGERIAVIGKNGAGKSTMAKLFCGAERPQTGKVLVAGDDISKKTLRDIGEYVGYVMQNPNDMLIKDTIAAETELALNVRDTPRETVIAKASAALKACNLYEMRSWPIDSVSYGQKKRITVAAILVLEPNVLIMDEPTAGQDYASYTDIMRFVEGLYDQYGITILFVTHDMHLALEYTDRALVFADGKMIADAPVYEILSDDDIISEASLKKTSLSRLAEKIGLDPKNFIQKFIQCERALVLTDE